MSTIQTCLHRQTGPGHAENITEIHNVFFLCVFLLVVLCSYDFIWNSKWLALLQNWGVDIFHGRIVVSIKGSLKVNFRVTDFRKPIHHSQEMSQPWDLTAKRSHSQEISTSKRSHSQEISTAKRSHSQEISTAKRSPQPKDLTAKRSPQPRDLTAKRSHSQEISTARRSHSQEVSTAKRSHSQEISQPRDLTAKRPYSQEISTAKRFHSQEISTAKRSPQPRDLTAKGSHSQESLARKLRFRIFHFQILGKSRMQASFPHLALSDFDGSLARKLRFHIFSYHFLREVSHEIRFWEIADARHAVFCRTQRVSEDGRGSLSGGRFRNTLVCTGIMVGSAALWSCQFRRRFVNVLACSSILFCNSVSADRIVMAASRSLGAAAACVILLSFAVGHRKSYWSGCIKAAIVICQQIFSILALVIFLLKFLLKSASIFFKSFGVVEIRFWSCNLWRRCA